MNVIVLWNTIYLERALEHLHASGHRIELEDEVRLSPLQHGHINVHGRYQFSLPEALQRGEFRPLRERDDIALGLRPEILSMSSF